jgi:hypothetical protein
MRTTLAPLSALFLPLALGCAPQAPAAVSKEMHDASSKPPPMAPTVKDAGRLQDVSSTPPSNIFGKDSGIVVIHEVDGASLVADASCAAVEQAAEALPSTAADIIWIVDNSGSMTFEAHFVQQNLNVFSRLISSGGVDARVVLISMPANTAAGTTGTGICIAQPLGSGNCPDDTSYPRLFHVPEVVNSNDELDKLMATYPQWRGVLRKGVAKTFVVVTDDNSYTPAATFTSWVQSQTAFQNVLWRFSGIFCPVAGGTECAAQGVVYNDLVRTTGGVTGDLSKQDFAPVFMQLASSVVKDAVPVDCQWTIPTPSGGGKIDPDAVNVRFTQEDGTTETLEGVVDSKECDDVHGGWYYDDPAHPTRVVACDSSCRVMQSDHHARVEVLFGCARKVRKIVR